MWRYVLPSSLLVVLVGCQPEGDEAATDTSAAVADTLAPAAAPTPTSTAAQDTPEAKIASAMSAAPEGIAKAATIMDWPATEGGEMKQLRAGTNGWVCHPTTPAAIGAAGQDPMCLDKTFQEWVQAWAAKKTPSAKTVGIAYMLQGDIGTSNTDPYATGPTADNQWVKTGPHIMIVSPSTAQIASLPTDPAQGGPWVMWKGTPYAHLMVPVPAR